MKKLNRKGFTLIELLAIIVILAIIMVVTIPSMLDLLGNATPKQFKNSADAIEKWVSDTYVLAAVGQGDASGATNTFLSVCDRAATKLCTTTVASKNSVTLTADGLKNGFSTTTGSDAEKAMAKLLQAAGQKPGNYSSVSILVDSATNRVCVKVVPSTGGDFAEAGTYKEDGTLDTTKTINSNGC